MRFHDYKTMKPAGFRGSTEDFISSYFLTADDGSEHSAAATARGAIEVGWIRRNRPFYNVYPIATELCVKTSLTMKWGDILFPTRYILLRFPAGHEPLGIKSALLRVPTTTREHTKIETHATRMRIASEMSAVPLGGVIESKTGNCWGWTYHSGLDIREQPIGECLDLKFAQNRILRSCGETEKDGTDRTNYLVRLLAFIGLLARGNDLITPAILSKDREEYDATTDEARKRWLEDRAARRQGRGFDIGRSLEIERATSPHWRQPHLALFHTGPGRNVPVLKLRSGCVVIPKDMSQVPTGYMGEESPGEQPEARAPAYRPSVPWGLRFDIMRRDGHRCRLCGLTADDGVRLEVDHIIPVAKGGKTTKENLWLLCKPCNGGKSDKDLFLALEKNTQMVRKEVASGI